MGQLQLSGKNAKKYIRTLEQHTANKLTKLVIIGPMHTRLETGKTHSQLWDLIKSTKAH